MPVVRRVRVRGALARVLWRISGATPSEGGSSRTDLRGSAIAAAAASLALSACLSFLFPSFADGGMGVARAHPSRALSLALSLSRSH